MIQVVTFAKRGVLKYLAGAMAGLSLVLCALVVTMWVRSYWVGDQWLLRKDSQRNGRPVLVGARVYSTSGGVEASIEYGHARGSVRDVYELQHSDAAARELIFQSLDRTLLERLGRRLEWEPASFVHGEATTDGTAAIVNFPYWIAAIAFGVMPLVWMMGVRRRGGRMRGYCAFCGEDVRGTPERCPECGGVRRDA
jgi:hypothetical protein